ncbi:hypothetical protein OU995_15555 [Roseateles sp. SL47]|uniref:iron-containing redox enzyme family protein n=1 Tax=Roseateles sp. SL47 TaxID=2995138 RepID=UPI00226F35D3|nr:iron-containing redox enzyme family protein [Roseateles sp. SL47]WAC71023.1 hypothetical protein OU995_15555 [Roseateles sp. SL47]
MTPADAPLKARSGREFILGFEEVMDALMETSVQCNRFWTAIRESPETVPRPVYFGMCLENFHILAREPLFDGPVLAFSGNHAVRTTLNRFYAEELGHDKLLLSSLAALGLTEDEVRHSIPLPTTWALIDGLAYWSRFEPLFFAATLGILEGREVAEDAFVGAARRRQLSKGFVDPMMAHARINAVGRHGELSREVFGAIEVVTAAEQARLRELLPLFVALYDDFYTGIWHHYAAMDDGERPLPGFLRQLEVLA